MSSSHINSDLLLTHNQAHLEDHHDYDDQTVVMMMTKRPPSSSSSSSATSTTAQNNGAVKTATAARGKTQIRLIENQTNRQVTYSKRRSGIFKKARELAVLCDAKVCLILIPHNGNRMHYYTSDNTTTKEMIDMYRQISKVDLWKPQYERMQQMLRVQEEKNYELKREIRQRKGFDLEDLSFNDLNVLENSMSIAVENIRSKKYHKIESQTLTGKKKVKSLEDRQLILLQNCQAKCEDPPYGLVEDNVEGLGYIESIALANGASNMYAFRHGHGHGQVNCHSTMLHGGGGGVYNPYNAHDLRLA